MKLALPGHVRAPRHGTHAGYVSGCRCADCKSGHAATVRARTARAKAAARALGPAVPGTICPGAGGAPCKNRSKLRAGSQAVCHRCADRLVWNGLVDAAPVRKHLRALSRRGVGYRAVAAAASVGCSTIQKIVNGTRTRIRKERADAILAVTSEAISDHALVPAGPTWKMLRALEPEYLTKRGLAQALGSTAKVPALQFGKRRVLARTELRVRKLYRKAVG
jgi:hypothetical protein